MSGLILAHLQGERKDAVHLLQIGYRSEQIYKNSRSQLKIIDARWMTCSSVPHSGPKNTKHHRIKLCRLAHLVHSCDTQSGSQSEYTVARFECGVGGGWGIRDLCHVCHPARHMIALNYVCPLGCKSARAPGRLNFVPCFLWALSIQTASCHPSGVWNF
jgi:hypothetical protein